MTGPGESTMQSSMRLSRLVGSEVVDADGTRVGEVADLVLQQGGGSGHGTSMTGVGLIVTERSHLRLFGYDRDLKPVVLRWLVRRRAGRVLEVSWDQVASVGAGRVALRVRADRLG